MIYELITYGHKKPVTSIQRPVSSIQNRGSSIEYPEFRIQNRVSSIARPATSNQQPATSDGFTLLEILLSFLILGIVMTTIMASFNAVFSTTDTLKNSSQYFEMAKNCLNRMTRDFEALYVQQSPLYKPPDFDDPPDPYRIVGSTADVGGTSFATIRFTSSAHIPLDKNKRDGIAEIIYYVQAKNDGQLVLKRADHLYPYPPFEEKGGDPVLCIYLKSLVLKYIDAEDSESDEWDSDSDEYGYATPAAVRIQLEVGNETTSYDFETTIRLAVQRQKIG
jgi:general secretion pathway protein J